MSKEPDKSELVNQEYYLHRKLYVIPCPYWKRESNISELIDNYKPLTFENDFKNDWELKERLEEEYELFRRYYINIKGQESKTHERASDVLEISYDDEGEEQWLYHQDTTISYSIFKGSNILFNGKFV